MDFLELNGDSPCPLLWAVAEWLVPTSRFGVLWSRFFRRRMTFRGPGWLGEHEILLGPSHLAGRWGSASEDALLPGILPGARLEHRDENLTRKRS